VGIAIYPDDCTDNEQLINYADNAMYDIKKSGNKDGYKFFDAGMINAISRAQLVGKTVANSVPEQDYILHFQPQVDVNSKEIMGVEVYPHLKGDMENISPAELIPVAEECGLMSRLGIWIVMEAFKTVADWKKRIGKDLSLTINLSPLQLLDAEFIESLERECAEFDVPTNKLILDISSNVIMGATNSARDTMEAFHNFGFKLSLNDFGGSSINLSYLMNCGINYIKLSRKLISEVETDKATRVLIDSIIRFSSAMDIKVTAVGVETESQYHTLKDMGITKMQGFLISKPVRREEFEKILIQGIDFK
jgi:EAL domain-containing protein (putative c-di-GMP-specific phosphodiesterase class I)